MIYEGAIFRPPSEAYSLILQITIGCRHNQCTFCSMYKGKTFRVRPKEEIKKIIAMGAQEYPHTKRIFLADGDALACDTELLSEVLKDLYNSFPHLERVGVYGGPKDILEKSLDELIHLKEQGLGIIYLGVESGSAQVLKDVNKGVTPEEMIAAGQRAMASGIKLSCTIIIGLGGKELMAEHARETARVINAMDPHYLGALTLMLAPGAPLAKKVTSKEFTMLNTWETLEELYLMIQDLQLSDCVFRSNHASNYLPLRAHFPEEKEALLRTLKEVIENQRQDVLRPEFYRGL